MIDEQQIQIGDRLQYSDRYETKLYTVVGLQVDCIQVRPIDAPPARADIFRVDRALLGNHWQPLTAAIETEDE